MSVGTSLLPRVITNDVGEPLFRTIPNKSVALINERILHIKVKRRLGRYFADKEMHLTERIVNTLSIVNTYLILCDSDKAPQTRMLEWSGYTKAWVNQYKWGIEKCVELDYLQKTEYRNTGISIRLTNKGKSIIEVYNQMWDVVLQELVVKQDKLIRISPNKNKRLKRYADGLEDSPTFLNEPE